MADEVKVTKKRDLFSSRLKEKNPEKEYVDDEEIFGQAMDDYDNYEKGLSEYREREQTLSNLFEQHPESASFFADWRDGGDPIVLMIQRYGDDFKDALDDPEKLEAIAQANKAFAERVAENDKFEKEFEKNVDASNEEINKVVEEDGVTDDAVDSALVLITTIAKDYFLGKISAETIRMALKALNYDADVEEAEAVGEVRGRNAKIEEKLRKPGKGDGTANLSGKHFGGVNRELPELGAIERYNNLSNIWERGGEKRKKF